MKKYLSILMITMMVCFTIIACDNDKDGDEDTKIELSNPDDEKQNAYADEESGGFSFTAKAPWEATIKETTPTRASVSWLRLLFNGEETYKGAAGTFTLTIEMDINYSGNTRSATITIKSGNDMITITVTQDGKTVEGIQPEIPKLITRIVGTGDFASDYFEHYPDYHRHFYEFKYDDRSFKFNGYNVRNPDGTLAYSYAYSYDVTNEVNIYDETNSLIYKAALGSNGYVKEVKNMNDTDPTIFSYTTDGYLSRTENLYHSNYVYTWDNGNFLGKSSYQENPGEAEPISNPNVYSNTLNDKTNLNLNVFFFEIDEMLSNRGDYYSEFNLFALIDLAGKRSKNYMVEKGGDEMYPNAEVRIYTEETEPKTGVIATRYSREIQGNGSYTFDSESYPVSYSYDVKVEKHVETYNGQREYVEPRDEQQREEWTHVYGKGPWFKIKTSIKTQTYTDIYRYEISYNK